MLLLTTTTTTNNNHNDNANNANASDKKVDLLHPDGGSDKRPRPEKCGKLVSMLTFSYYNLIDIAYWNSIYYIIVYFS